MPDNFKGLLRYYRDCFKEDSADFNLKNLKKLSSEDLLILQGEDEIASGNLHRLPIPKDHGESLSKRLEIYLRERVLLHCSLFIVGKLSTNNDEVTLFSPLVTSEASIESDEYGYYFQSEHPTANEELLSLFFPEQDELPKIDTTRIYDATYWVQLLEQSPINVNTSESLWFPKLIDSAQVKKAQRKRSLSLVAVSTLAFVERSASSRGVLHELNKIIDSESTSAPLNTLLRANQTQRNNHQTNINCHYVPALLSQSQKRILELAATKSLGVVSGPPGTGKSYSVAAIAAEHFTREQSVLVVANSEVALDVIADTMRNDFGLDNLVVRAGKKEVLKEFKQYLDDLLAGYHDDSEASKSVQYQKQLNDVLKKIDKCEKALSTLCGNAIKLGQRTHKVTSGTANFCDRLRYKLNSNSILRLSKIRKTQILFNDLLKEKEEICAKLITAQKAKVISNLLSSDRKAIQGLNKASRARTSSKQLEYFAAIDFEKLLGGFPVWLVSLSSLHKVLPLKKEMFDVVIVDEATQSNISSVLPALARAKRAVIVGDQKQLKHFSFLAKSKEQELANNNGVKDSDKALSYRDNSIMDLALGSTTDHQQVAFLDEHFRSQPELIHFSNQQFYSNKLKVMQHRPCSTTGHIELVRVDGQRSETGINEAEAKSLLSKLSELIDNDRNTGVYKSIGVLSPFSKQANYLAELIENYVSLEDIKNHNIRVATAFGFRLSGRRARHYDDFVFY